MLTLMTYADIAAVSPEALTPWKAESLWQLYMVASNYLTRSVDDERVHLIQERSLKIDRVRSILGGPACSEALEAFLEGFPRRYLAMHSAEQIAAHFGLAQQLPQDPVQVSLVAQEANYELTVVTADRPFLFATLTGILAAWGMNILKADAFSNAAGTVLDTFRFTDLFHTLKLNPPEMDRLRQTVVDVLVGKQDLAALMKGRIHAERPARLKVAIPTQVRFDNTSAARSTVLELITHDRPGLLYRVSSTLAELGCNIETALIDTEAQKVIDVFHLTWRGSKLTGEQQEAIRQRLFERLAMAHWPGPPQP